MPEALYHPNFEPPLAWLRSCLLVYDNIWSIVPREAGYEPSDNLKRHLEKLPDTFAPLAPEPLDIVHEYFVLNVLRRAFKQIAESRQKEKQGRQIRFRETAQNYEEEGLEISGIARLHDAKVAYTVHQMLEEFDLIYGEEENGFLFVDERAAFLIVSFLAQRMASRLPLRTITDIDSSFYLSAACNVIESGNPMDSRGALASAVLKFHIPEQIEDLSLSEFIEVRKRYSELRQIFPLYLRDLSELFRVDDAKNVPELKERIVSTVKAINRDVLGIKRSRVKARVKRWLPIGIGSAVTLGAAFLPDSPSIKYITGAATVAVQILTEVLNDSPIPGRLQGAQSLLLSANRDIIDASKMAWSLSPSTLV